MKLSSIIIAKNEEHNIKRCIESQLNVIDDIVVVVDSSTTDKTFEIAKSYEKVNCIKKDWMGYSKTKSFAVENTKHDWIFWIDADEALRPELVEELIEFKETEPEFDVYSVKRRAYFIGKWIKHSGWYPGKVNRLFNKKRVKFSNSEVHEHLIFNGNAGELKNDLDHYTDPNLEHYLEKFNKYTSLATADLINKGKNPSLLDILLRPPFMFFKMYILKKGFLDGIHGFILAVYSSFYVFTKYTKLWEARYENRNNT